MKCHLHWLTETLFGPPPHTGAEASQVEAELDLAAAAARAVDDSDMEGEAEQAQAASIGAKEIIQDAKKAAETADDMSITLGGFTDPLPTDVAPLPPPFLSHGQPCRHIMGSSLQQHLELGKRARRTRCTGFSYCGQLCRTLH